MAAEVRGGEAVRAWIWQPQHELGYVAERGAWRAPRRRADPPGPRAGGGAAGVHLPARAGSAGRSAG